MTEFAVQVQVEDASALGSAWVALAGRGLRPSLPMVPPERRHDVVPIVASVEAETPGLAERRVRDALTALPGDRVEIGRARS